MKIIINGWRVNIPWYYRLATWLGGELPYYSWKQVQKQGQDWNNTLAKKGQEKELTILIYATNIEGNLILGPFLFEELIEPLENSRYFLNMARWKDVVSLGVLIPSTGEVYEGLLRISQVYR